MSTHTPVGVAFMRGTRFERLEPPGHEAGLPQPPLELPAEPSADKIALPSPAEATLLALDLRTLIAGRQSVRQYAPAPLSLAELSHLLWCTQGVLAADPFATRRTVPSAGARHAFESYLLVNRVKGLPRGLYRFLAQEHRLQLRPGTEEIAPALAQACLDQEMLETCAVAFIWVAVVARMTWRYSQRGYRYLHLDAGHVCQNLYLAAESLGCGACAIAAFDDDALDDVLGVDGDEQFAIYLATVGRKPAHS